MSRPYARFFSLLFAVAFANVGLVCADEPAIDDKEKAQNEARPTVDLRERLARVGDDTRIRPVQLEPQPGSLDATSEDVFFRSVGVGMFAASAGDLATTEWGLAQGHHEANPLARSRSVRYSHHIAGPAAVWYTTRELHRSGRTKLALFLRVSLMAAYGYAAVHNARQLNQP